MARAAGSLAAALSALLLAVVVVQVTAVKPIPGTWLDKEDGSRPVLQEHIMREVNSNPNAGWEADFNPALSAYTLDEFKVLLGAKLEQNDSAPGLPMKIYPDTIKEALPKEFDARTAWPQCTSIGKIREQGHCGSCWAVSAAETLSDRFCIHLGQNITLSPNDLLSCCGYCGSCSGGYHFYAWDYLTEDGLVTEECDPYFDHSKCPHPGCVPGLPTPSCEQTCKGGNQSWSQSKHFSASAYWVNSDHHDIMAEIFTNGPVQVNYRAYADFPHYKSGVYKHVTGNAIGGHAVKLIGWGVSEAGENYWLAANQWSDKWGDNGYFKIARGVNECRIEEKVVGGTPSTKKLA